MNYVPLLAGAALVLAGGYALAYAYRRGNRPFQAAWLFCRAKRWPTPPVRVMKGLFYLVSLALVAVGVYLIGTALSAW